MLSADFKVVQARYVTFGEKEAYIAYKRSSYPGKPTSVLL